MKTKHCRAAFDFNAVRITTPQAKRNKHVPRWVEYLALVIVAAVAVIPTAM